jgi:malonyl CoA-acyl carrier protein transacylase/acyl carrier protein
MADNIPTDPGPVVLFPGQGGFDGAALRHARGRYPQVDQVFERIDTTTREMFSRGVSELLFGTGPADLRRLLAEEPWVSQVAIFGSSLAAYEILADQGLVPGVLVGHSLGEVAALVAAGAYSVEDGAWIAAKRVQVIEELRGPELADGRMVALSADAGRVQKLLDLVAEPHAVVAAENHDEQTVVSGPAAAIEKVRAIAGHVGVGVVELESPFPFHTPVLAEVVPYFAAHLDKLEQHPLQARVYSPILQRYYEPHDQLAHLLAEHLVRPVRFAAALRELATAGHCVFLEAGGRATLSKLATKVRSGRDPLVLPTFAQVGEDSIALTDTLARLRVAGLVTSPDPGLLRPMLVPDASGTEFDAFWVAHGPELADLVRDRFRSFRSDAVTEPPPVPPRNPMSPDTPVLPAAAVPAAPPAAVIPDRQRLFTEIRAVYAEALEYPEEVFTGEVLLEAELGVDSVKQVELLTRVSRRYGLPQRDNGFRLADYHTMDRIVDLIHTELTGRNP